MSINVVFYDQYTVGSECSSGYSIANFLNNETEISYQHADLKWLHPRNKNYDHDFLMHSFLNEKNKQKALAKFVVEQYVDGEAVFFWVPRFLTFSLEQQEALIENLKLSFANVRLVELSLGHMVNKLSGAEVDASLGHIVDESFVVSNSSDIYRIMNINFTRNLLASRYRAFCDKKAVNAADETIEKKILASNVMLDIEKNSDVINAEVDSLTKAFYYSFLSNSVGLKDGNFLNSFK